MRQDHSFDVFHILKSLGFYPRGILDIGAQLGHWTIPINKIWPKADIFIVDANRDHEENMKNLPMVSGYEIALLGDRNKKSVKYFASVKKDSGGNSIFREQTSYFDECEIRHLPMTTLDDLVKKNGLKNIDLIKIDTQGSELNIIKGGRETVAKAEFILLELQNLEYNLGAPDATDVILKMKRLGFSIFAIPLLHQLPSGEMVQFDVLFAKKNSRFTRRGILI